MRKDQKQQGDVLFKRIASIPSDAKPTRSPILASGEHTGHHHEVDVLDIAGGDVEVFEKEGVKFLKTTKNVTIRHPEHKEITVEPGIWQIGIVREYDYFEDMARQVRD